MKIKVKKDSDKTIVRLQRKEIDDLMSEGVALKADVSYYKDKYNEASVNFGLANRRTWERGIVIDVLLNRIDELEKALGVPNELKTKAY